LISKPYILFDYDGVLIKQVDFAGNVSRRYDLNEKKLRSFFEKYLVYCLKGEQDMVRQLSFELNDIGWHKDSISLFSAIYTENQIYNNDLLEYIRAELSPKYPCYIATNQDRRRYKLIRDSREVKGLFRKVFCSSELGINKPEISYYEKVYSRLLQEEGEINKDQILFIDDSLENIKSAELFGLNIHYYEDFKGFEQWISDWLSGKKSPSLRIGDFGLEEMKLSHSKKYSEILSEPNKYQFLTESGPIDEEQASLKVIRNRRLSSRRESIYWSIIGINQEFIGFLGIHNYQSPKVFLSYGIHPNYRRRGIASTVLKGLLNWKELDGKTKVMAIHIENNASYEMLKKLDLNYQGIKIMRQGKRHVFEI